MSSDEVDISKIIEEVHVPYKTVSIIEDTTVGADTLVIDEIHMSDSASDDLNEIVSLLYCIFLLHILMISLGQ